MNKNSNSSESMEIKEVRHYKTPLRERLGAFLWAQRLYVVLSVVCLFLLYSSHLAIYVWLPLGIVGGIVSGKILKALWKSIRKK